MIRIPSKARVIAVALSGVALLAGGAGVHGAFTDAAQVTQRISTGRLHLSITAQDGSDQGGPWRSVSWDDELYKHTWPKQTATLHHELVVTDDGTVPARSLWLTVSPGANDKQVATQRFDLQVTVTAEGQAPMSLPARSLADWEAGSDPVQLPLSGALEPGDHVTIGLTVSGAAAPGLLNPDLSPTYTFVGSD